MEGTDSRVMLGFVTGFSSKERYGFASTVLSDEEVFVHADTLREVNGSYKDATLSDRRVKELPSSLILQPAYPTMVIMAVVRTKEGLKAEAWGLIPQNNWRIALILQDRFSHFVGGAVVIRSLHGELKLTGWLKDYHLIPSKLNLTLADARRPSEDECRTEELARRLTEHTGAKPDFSLPFGRFAIILPSSSERLTFHLPDDNPPP